MASTDSEGAFCGLLQELERAARGTRPVDHMAAVATAAAVCAGALTAAA